LVAARNATAVVRNWAAVAIAALAIVNAMAVADSKRTGGAKPPAHGLNELRKSIAEPIKTRSNSLMDRSISISKTWY
jgi:hypothetical protein